MLYNDKETKDFEEKFESMLAKAILFMVEKKDKLEAQLKIVAEQIQLILDKPDKTDEETAFLKTIPETLKPILQSIEDTQLILREGAFRQSIAFYEHVKQLALGGDEKAMKMYEDLKTVYEAMIKSRISDN